jgi:hypothetical protein
MPLVVGVDSSTTSCKVEVRDADTGELVASGRAPHPTTTPPRSEQEPAAWRAAFDAACAEAGVPGIHRPAAVAVAAQQHGLVVTEGSGLDSRRHGVIVSTREFAPLLDGYHRRTLENGWVIVKIDHHNYLTTQPPHRLQPEGHYERDPKKPKPQGYTHSFNECEESSVCPQHRSHWVHKELTYSDYGAAHDKALKLQMAGAKTILIKAKNGKHHLTWMEDAEERYPNEETFKRDPGHRALTRKPKHVTKKVWELAKKYAKKPTMAVPWTPKSLPTSVCRQRSPMRAHTGSSSSQVSGYFARSHARSSGPGTTRSNQTDARYEYALA